MAKVNKGARKVTAPPRPYPAISPKGMRLGEDAARGAFNSFPVAGEMAKGVSKSKGQPQTSLNLGIGKQKKSKRND